MAGWGISNSTTGLWGHLVQRIVIVREQEAFLQRQPSGGRDRGKGEGEGAGGKGRGWLPRAGRQLVCL